MDISYYNHCGGLMIVINKEDCIRCGACQGVCPTGAISVKPEDVIYCDMCGGEPKCVEACPNDALRYEDITLEGGIKKKKITYSPEKCDKCGECVKVCPPGILKLVNDGKASRVPLEGFCVLCQQCVNVCPIEVIGIEGVKEPSRVEIKIDKPIYIVDCVGCGLCVPECPVNAITLPKYGESIEIDEEKCIKCGICAQTCPWNSVYISGKKPQKRSRTIENFTLDKEKCIGCNTCVEICPGGFIEPKSDLTVSLPEICPACGLCEKLCPTDAIELEVKLGPAKPVTEEGIVYNDENCKFCGRCALNCPNEAIRVVSPKGRVFPGLKKVDEKESYTICTTCGACTTVCPTGALKLVEVSKKVNGETVKRNRIQYNPSLCDKCGNCVDVCPYGILKLTDDEKLPVKGFCILCEKCIDACRFNALLLK